MCLTLTIYFEGLHIDIRKRALRKREREALKAE